MPADEMLGVRFMPVSDANSLARGFTLLDEPGQVRAGLSGVSPEDLPPGTDVTLLAQGYVTIHLIRANADAGAENLEEMSRRLNLDGR